MGFLGLGDNWGGNQAPLGLNNAEVIPLWNTPVAYGNLRVGRKSTMTTEPGGGYGFLDEFTTIYKHVDAINGHLVYFYLDNDAD